MLTKLRRIFARKTPPTPPPVPPPAPCLKDKYLVPFCQWRSGDNCLSAERREWCTGVWEKGMGR
ncbi:MAG: hypothetical protein Q8O55_01680 [Dehalococcoidales bacterium]|nr:hypothetical protein [Dehalococcoidales bacterium]